MKKGILLTVFTIMSATLFGQSLYSKIANSEDHTVFLDLLEFFDLDTLLINDDYYSVFVPNNEAFESRFDLDTLESYKVNDPEFLESLLLNHFIPDTVFVEFISEYYLPLSGSNLFLFIDGAGTVSINSFGAASGEPYPYLSGTFSAGDHFIDYDNGRLLWMEHNVIHPNCQPSSDWDEVVSGPLVNIMIQSDWIDTVLAFTTPKTFLCPSSNDIYEYIDQNGGFSNTTFVDSLIRRHIIDGYMPLQDIEDDLVVKNLLGEDLYFSKQNGQYYLNDSIEISYFYDYKKSATLRLGSFLVESIVSNTVSTDLDHFKFFPNPATDVITLVNEGQENGSTVNIFSIDGNFIRKLEFFGSKTNVNISDLNPGFYILEYRNNSNLERTKLLVL